VQVRLHRQRRAGAVEDLERAGLLAQRLLGIGDVDWDTAGTDAPESDFTFRGIDDPSALVRLADRFTIEAMRSSAAGTPPATPPPAT